MVLPFGSSRGKICGVVEIAEMLSLRELLCAHVKDELDGGLCETRCWVVVFS